MRLDVRSGRLENRLRPQPVAVVAQVVQIEQEADLRIDQDALAKVGLAENGVKSPQARAVNDVDGAKEVHEQSPDALVGIGLDGCDELGQALDGIGDGGRKRIGRERSGRREIRDRLRPTRHEPPPAGSGTRPRGAADPGTSSRGRIRRAPHGSSTRTRRRSCGHPPPSRAP